MWIEVILFCCIRGIGANPDELGGEILAKKCCAHGEYMQFDIKGVGTCKRLEKAGASKQLFERVEQILNRDPAESTDFEWLPQEFRIKETNNLWVKYSQNILCPRSHALFIGSGEKYIYRLGEKGSLILKANSTGGHIVELPFSNREYCIDAAKGFNSPHVYMICPCERTRCIPKCCAIDRVLRFRGDGVECKFVRNLKWKPFPRDLTLEKDITYTVLEGQFPDCAYRIQHKEEIQWPDNYVRSWFSPSKGRVFENKDMCTDSLWNDAAPLSRTIVSCAITPHVVGFLDRRTIIHLIATVMMVISIIALINHAASCTVHILSLCSYFVSLFFYHILLVSILWPKEPLFPCSTVGFLLYYFTLSSATWLSIAAFNTSVNSRDLINALLEDQRKKCVCALCIFYSIYAWGLPAILVAFTYSVRGTSELPQHALRPSARTTRTCPDGTGNVAKSDTFIYFSAPLTLLLIFVTFLFTTIGVIMRILREMISIRQRPETLQERSFYVKWRTIIYLKLMVTVMVLEFVFELLEWRNEDPTNHIFEILTDFLGIARVAGIFIYWGTKLYWKLLQIFLGLQDLPVSEQVSDDESSPRIEPAEPPIQPPSSQPGPSQAAGDAASTSGVGSGSGSSETVLQTPQAVIRSGWWKWKFPYPRPRSQSPAGVTVAPLTEESTPGHSLPLTPDTPAPVRRASQISITPPQAGPSEPSTSSPCTDTSQLSVTPPAGQSQLSSRSPRARPSRLSISPSQLSTSSPRTEPSQLSSTPPTTGPPSSTTSPARVERSPKTPTTHSSAASSPTRASPVRALFGRTSPARTSAGSSSSSSPSSTPPRPSVHMISLNPAGPSEDLIAHEQESPV